MSNKRSFINENGILMGTKFYRYVEDELEVLRLIRYKQYNGKYRFKNIKTGEMVSLTAEDIIGEKSEYVKLNPDGFITFNIVKMGEVEDIMVCLHRKKDLTTSISTYAVCRQLIQDFFIDGTILAKSDVTNVGCSVSKDTVPVDIGFEVCLSCDSISYMRPVAIYLDDDLEDLENYIYPAINISNFDNVLVKTRDYLTKNIPNVQGLCGSVKELLVLNHFMMDFYRGFDIITLPISLMVDTKSGNYENSLNPQQVVFLEKEIGKKIAATYVIEYSKELPIHKFQRDYRLVRTLDKKLFVIGYDTVDEVNG